MASLIDLFKGSPYDNVPADTNTVIEQETTGLRRQSLVDINNPLIYGSDIIRIATKSTPSLNTMKESTNGELSTGGLLGKGLSILSGGKIQSLNDVRNSINDTLGIPTPLIPTRVSQKIQGGKTVQEVLDEKNGTELGKILKQGGGGTIGTIGRNLLGSTITRLKSEASKILIGTPGQIGINQTPVGGPDFNGTPLQESYSDIQTKTDGFDSKGSITKEDIQVSTQAKFNIDLANFSPIYGVRRGSKLYDSNLGNRIKQDTPTNVNLSQGLSPYDPQNPYTGQAGTQNIEVVKNSLEVRRGITNKNDIINSTGPNDTYTTEEMEGYDLVPFWVGKIGEEKRTHFRTLITGLSETVSPTWNSSKFFGNPYSFYSYGGVDRSVTFSLFIYCMNPIELGNNWEKINKLTQYTYPTITQSEGLSNPPIIQFRIGDIYNGNEGYIESLTYTFPDNGTWETDLDGFNLPKFVEVSISIKLIEQIGTEISLYKYKRSSAATKEQNDYLENTNFSTDATFQSNGQRNSLDRKLKLNTNGTTPDFGIQRPSIKDINTGLEQTLPAEFINTIPNKTGETGIGELSEKELARVYRIPNAEIERELKFLGKGQNSTVLV